MVFPRSWQNIFETQHLLYSHLHPRCGSAHTQMAVIHCLKTEFSGLSTYFIRKSLWSPLNDFEEGSGLYSGVTYSHCLTIFPDKKQNEHWSPCVQVIWNGHWERWPQEFFCFRKFPNNKLFHLKKKRILSLFPSFSISFLTKLVLYSLCLSVALSFFIYPPSVQKGFEMA